MLVVHATPDRSVSRDNGDVGYGDIGPKTTVGRLIALAVMIVSIGLVAMLTGALAQKFVEAEFAQVDGRGRPHDALSGLSVHSATDKKAPGDRRST